MKHACLYPYEWGIRIVSFKQIHVNKKSEAGSYETTRAKNELII